MSTSGWFDLFREGGGPTMYAHPNRTPVYGDLGCFTLIVSFATLYMAFFIIFPGIRNQRFTTFLSVTLSLFVGFALLISIKGSSWHVAESDIATAYQAHSTERIMGRMGVYFGLDHANATLTARPHFYGNHSNDIMFNDRFYFIRPTQLAEEHRFALSKGLPFPLLTVSEYLAADTFQMHWGRTYREAGYYTMVCLWSAFTMWIMMNLLIVILPRYGAYMMTATGVQMLFANLVYYVLVPSEENQLLIRLDDIQLVFEFGWSFWLVLVAGIICFITGGSIAIIDLIYPNKFSTVIEMDYGTAFDRHIIIEDSHERKKRKKISSNPRLPLSAMPRSMFDDYSSSLGFGGFFRRLSKYGSSKSGHHRHGQGALGSSSAVGNNNNKQHPRNQFLSPLALNNSSFDMHQYDDGSGGMNPPQSPWKSSFKFQYSRSRKHQLSQSDSNSHLSSASPQQTKEHQKLYDSLRGLTVSDESEEKVNGIRQHHHHRPFKQSSRDFFLPREDSTASSSSDTLSSSLSINSVNGGFDSTQAIGVVNGKKAKAFNLLSRTDSTDSSGGSSLSGRLVDKLRAKSDRKGNNSKDHVLDATTPQGQSNEGYKEDHGLNSNSRTTGGASEMQTIVKSVAVSQGTTKQQTRKVTPPEGPTVIEVTTTGTHAISPLAAHDN